MLTVRDIVIFGCGGHGRELLQILLDQNRKRPKWRFRGFLVTSGFEKPEMVHGFPVARDLTDFGAPEDLEMAVGLGNPAARRQVVGQLRAQGVRSFPSLVHPGAWLGTNVVMGEGVIICAGANLTTDIVLGDHSHVNIGSTVSHDTIVGAFSTLGPGVHLAGRVRLGEGVEIGAGACVIPNVSLGAGAVIGAAAAVVRDVPAGCTAAGVPARVIRRPED